MANTNNRPMPTIGVDRYTFFEVISDTKEKTEYGSCYPSAGTPIKFYHI